MVLDPVIEAGNPALEADDADDDRLLFGPNQARVVAFLQALSQATPAVWDAIFHIQLEFVEPEGKELRLGDYAAIERAGRAGEASGAITSEDLRRTRAMADDAVSKVLPVLVNGLMARFPGEPRERVESMSLHLIRSGANAIVTLLLVHPWMTPEEWESAWGPYAELLPGFGEI